MSSETQNILPAALMLVSKDFEVNECGANFDRNFILPSGARHCNGTRVFLVSYSNDFLCHIFFI